MLHVSLSFFTHANIAKTSIPFTQPRQIQEISILSIHQPQKHRNIYPVHTRTININIVHSRPKSAPWTCSLKAIFRRFRHAGFLPANPENPSITGFFAHFLIHPLHQYHALNVQRGHELNVLYVFYQILGQENKSPLYFTFCVYTGISPWSEVE